MSDYIRPVGSCIIMASTCIGYASSFAYGGAIDSSLINDRSIDSATKASVKQQRKAQRKPFKAECNAQILLRELIGFEQWQIYRKTNRIIVKPDKHFWMIGNVFGRYNKFHPFSDKPDVVRIDSAKGLNITDFCAIQAGCEATPYTDKVIFFTLNLLNDEKEFVKTVNRIGEKKFNRMKECAAWSIGEATSKSDFHSSFLDLLDGFKYGINSVLNKIL